MLNKTELRNKRKQAVAYHEDLRCKEKDSLNLLEKEIAETTTKLFSLNLQGKRLRHKIAVHNANIRRNELQLLKDCDE